MTAGAVAAGTVVLIHAASATPPALGGPGPTPVPRCADSDLQIGWSAASVANSGAPLGPPPATYLLRLRNGGMAVCSLEGWPKLAITGPRALRTVPVSYGTVSFVLGKRGIVARVVKPIRVVLGPGATAVSAVTVSYPLMPMRNCASPAWTVIPPGGRSRTSLPGGGPGPTAHAASLPRLCSHSSVAVSAGAYMGWRAMITATCHWV